MYSTAIISVILISAASVPSEAAIFYEQLEERADFPGRCYVRATGMAYAPGQSWTSTTQCLQSTCSVLHEDRNDPAKTTYMISHATCGKAMSGPSCRLVEDSYRPYPDCCPRVVCSSPSPSSEVSDVPSNHVDVVAEEAPPPLQEAPTVDYVQDVGSNDPNDDGFQSPFRNFVDTSRPFRGKPLAGNFFWW